MVWVFTNKDLIELTVPLCTSVCLTQSQGFPQVGDVVEALQFRHPTAQQEREQVDEEAGMLADGEVGFVTHLLEPGMRKGDHRESQAEPEAKSIALDR